MLRPADDPLKEALALGREEAFATLYDRFAPSLFRVAVTLTGTLHDAEDAVQEVFTGVVRARRQMRKVENLNAYLFSALRRAAHRLSASCRERPLTSEELLGLSAPQAKGLDSEQALRLERALQTLPTEQREVIALKIEGGLTFAEIAVVLGIRPNTAASRYRYALEKLRASLGT